MFGNILWLGLKNGKTIFYVETFHLAKGILVLINVETSFLIFSNRDPSVLGFELIFLFLKTNLKSVWVTKWCGGKDHLIHIHQEKNYGMKTQLGNHKLGSAT